MTELTSRNPIALGVAAAGGALIVLATFLPIAERSGRFAYVQENSAIQHGGWLIALVGLGVMLTAFQSRNTKIQHWRLLASAVIAAGFVVVHMIANTSMRTLYPIGSDGTPDSSVPGVVAPAGLGIYVAGMGAALAVLGGLIVLTQHTSAAERELIAQWDAEDAAEAAPAKKKCPDCAETVLADANVCKHCTYRFVTG